MGEKPTGTRLGEDSAMATWYSDPDHRLLPFDATAEAKDAAEWIPRTPMLPMGVTLKVAKKLTTPWELLELLGDFETDKDQQVAEMMEPIKNWAVAAATKGKEENSGMATPLQPVTLPSKQLKAHLRRHVDRTLVERQLQARAAAAPSQQSEMLRSLMELSRMTMQSLTSQQRGQATATDVGDFYTKGVADALHMMQTQQSDTIHKGFTDVQKGALQGFCMSTTWENVPNI